MIDAADGSLYNGRRKIAVRKERYMDSILLLEDEESVSRGIAFTLEREGYTVYTASSVAEARALYESRQPQFVIADLTLPDGNGLDFIRDIRMRGDKSTYVLCLTALDNETDYVMGYDAGADDYVAKPFSLSVLSLKVRAYFGRSGSREPDEIRSGGLRVVPREMRAFLGEKEISFTRNEWKLLQMFLAHPKQIFTKSQMLERLFDTESDFADENTVAVNIRRLREKLHDDAANPRYIRNVRGIGYVWAMESKRG